MPNNQVYVSATHPYFVRLAVLWISEHEIVCCVVLQHGGCTRMLSPVTTRWLYAGASYNTEDLCWVLSQRGGCMLVPVTTQRLYAGSCHNVEVVCWVLSQRRSCMLVPVTTQRFMLRRLTTRRMYAGSCHNAEVVCWSVSPRGDCFLERLTTQGHSRAVNA